MDASMISKGMYIAAKSDTAPNNGCGFVFTGGACSVTTEKGDTVIVPSAFAGVIFPQAIVRVNNTGTDATTVIVFRG